MPGLLGAQKTALLTGQSEKLPTDLSGITRVTIPDPRIPVAMATHRGMLSNGNPVSRRERRVSRRERRANTGSRSLFP
jgi:hypothetical protein